MSDLIKHPELGASIAEKFIHYKKVEKEVQAALADLKASATKEVKDQGGFYRSPLGAVTLVTKKERRAKESLKTFLAENNLLEVLRKDDIDLKKLDDVISAGILEEDEVQKHLTVTLKQHLMMKN